MRTNEKKKTIVDNDGHNYTEHHRVTKEKEGLTARLSHRLVSEICITSKKTWKETVIHKTQ